MSQPESSSGRAWLVVLALGAAAAAVFAWLTLGVAGPLIFHDELIYMDGGTSLARDGVFAFRENPFGYGPIYPSLVAAALLVFEDRVTAYHALLALNAVLLGSACIPLFLLARRVARRPVAVMAVLVCLLLPSSFYAAYVMTDVLGYVIALWAFVALARVVERPSIERQAVALGACALAAAVRPQFVSLLGAYGLAVVVATSVRRDQARSVLRSYAPTLVLAAIAVVGLLAAAVIGRATRLLGAYEVLWRGYDPLLAARWFAYHVLDTALYVWLVPAMLLPAVIVGLWRRGRDDPQAAAVLGVSVGVTTSALVLAGLFGATEFAGGRLHDRYLFSIFPLWVIVVVDWAARSASAGRGVRALGAAGVAALAVLVPFHQVIDVESPNLFDAVATTAWSTIGEAVGRDGVLSSRTVFLAAVMAAGAVVVLAGPRGTRYALILSAGLIAVMASGQWAGALAASERGTFVGDGGAERVWVDRAAGESPATLLFVGTRACTESEQILRAIYVTEVFNAAVGEVVTVALGDWDEPASDPGRIRADGTVLRSSGEPLRAPLVLTVPGVVLAGEVVAEGTTRGLRLWRPTGPVRLLPPAPGAAPLARACGAPYPPPS